MSLFGRFPSSLSVAFAALGGLLLSGCLMTSDLQDLRKRAEAARSVQVIDCQTSPSDPSCVVTVACATDPNCDGYCDTNGACRPNSCRDNSLSTGETDMDCGGSLCQPCDNGKGCIENTDCSSGICEGNVCVTQASPPPPSPDSGSGGTGTGVVVVGDASPPDASIDGDAEQPTDCFPGCTCTTVAQKPRIYCTEQPLSWVGATSWCDAHGYALTSITSRGENDALGNTADWLNVDSFWIGANDRSHAGDWRWTNGNMLWTGGPAVCPNGASKSNDNHCYAASNPNTYVATYNQCLAMGTGWSLAKISSAQENTFVKNLIMTAASQKTPNYIEGWIGANDIAQEGTWGWVVGDSDATHVTPFWMGGAGGQKVNSSDYVNWEASNPGAEDCAIMAGNSGNWHDGACGFNARLGICEGPLNGPLPDTFAAFAETEPASSAHCVRYNTADFSWYTTDCNTPMPFVCSPP